jgi:hypothetical protein
METQDLDMMPGLSRRYYFDWFVLLGIAAIAALARGIITPPTFWTSTADHAIVKTSETGNMAYTTQPLVLTLRGMWTLPT